MTERSFLKYYSYMENIGQNIKSLRVAAHMTQAELAELLGVSQRTLCRYELSEREPDAKFVLSVCKLFKVSCDSLMDSKDMLLYDSIDKSDACRAKKALDSARKLSMLYSSGALDEKTLDRTFLEVSLAYAKAKERI